VRRSVDSKSTQGRGRLVRYIGLAVLLSFVWSVVSNYAWGVYETTEQLSPRQQRRPRATSPWSELKGLVDRRDQHCASTEISGPSGDGEWERTTRVWDKTLRWRDCENTADELYVWVANTTELGRLDPREAAQFDSAARKAMAIAEVWLKRTESRAQYGHSAAAMGEVAAYLRLGTLLGTTGGSTQSVAYHFLGAQEVAGLLEEERLATQAASWLPVLEALELKMEQRDAVWLSSLSDECADLNRGLLAGPLWAAHDLEPFGPGLTVPFYSAHKNRSWVQKRCRDYLASLSGPREAWLPSPLAELGSASRGPSGPPWIDNPIGRLFARSESSLVEITAPQLAHAEAWTAVLGSALERLIAEESGLEPPQPWLDPMDGKPVDWDSSSRTLRARTAIHEGRTFERRAVLVLPPSRGPSKK